MRTLDEVEKWTELLVSSKSITYLIQFWDIVHYAWPYPSHARDGDPRTSRKPFPGNPNFGKTGAAAIPLIDPPTNTEVAKTAPIVSNYTFPAAV